MADHPGDFDYVIVGAGSAGCVLANRLSESPQNRVLLLEAGRRDSYPWIHIPVGYLFCIDNPRTDWQFRTTGQRGLMGRALLYPRGKGLGGSSSINGMIYLRGHASDYDAWRALGNTGWGWADVLPLFKKSQDHYRGESALHGAGKEMRVETQRLSWPILAACRAAAIEAGIPASDDFNTGDTEGVGYFHVTQKGGFRQSSARAFLRPARHRANLTVLTGAMAHEIIFEQMTAKGVLFYHHDRLVHAGTRGEVILCAGAIATPQLLQVSGIGPGALLQRHGIAPVRANDGVGANLQDHLQLRCVFRIKNADTLNERANRFWPRIGMGLEYMLKRSGPLSMAPSQLGIFTKSDPALAAPDIQFHVQPISLDKFGTPLHPFPAITAAPCNLRPSSRGRVEMRTPLMTDTPVIDPNYLDTVDDQEKAVMAIRLARKIVAQPAFSPFLHKEEKPGAEAQSAAALLEAARAIGTTIFHPVGTARMGTGPDAVVGPDLRVRGVERLRVADASIMPQITSGNTNAPTIMIAEKAARLILER